MAWPALKFVWNIWLDPTSHLLLPEDSHSRPGDFVTLRGIGDLVAIFTACPDDMDPING